MTIKAFAQLCGCNPQTLRYYDHVNLLKPVKVDSWTGYRSYDEEQALLYVRIRNLQMAGFSIDEIKSLMDADHRVICMALGQKVQEQEEKLRKVKEIQQSYLSEIQMMKNKVEEVRELVTRSMAEYDPAMEFGIDEAEYRKIVDSLNSYFARPELTDADVTYDLDQTEEEPDEARYLSILNNPDYELIYELHCWEYAREVIKQFTVEDDGREYRLLFAISREKANQTAFANTALAVLLGRNIQGHTTNQKLGCNVFLSVDGKNHFWLLRSCKAN